MTTPQTPLSTLATPALILLTLAATVVAGPAAAAPAPTAVEPVAAKASAGDPILIGHRGAAGAAPENTIAAFKAGRAAGADFIETDVQLSKDGVPFLFHDDTPARTTNVADVFPGREHDPITSFTWRELRALDAGSSFGRKYAGERIPHLDDIARIANRRTGVYLEIKSPRNSPGVERLVARKLAQDPAWKKLVDAGKVNVLGFDASSNRKFAALAPKIPLQQLSGSIPGAETLEDWSSFVDSVGTSYRTLTAAQVGAVRAAGLDIGVYTVSSPATITAAVRLGVDMVTGDFPQQIVRLQAGQQAFPQSRGLEIADSVNNPAGDDVQAGTGEHVVVRNASRRTIDASGLVLRDAANNTLTVGQGYTIQPGGELRVYTGPGTNTATKYYNGRTASILNNTGDSVALWTARGQLQDVFAN
ncbi:glycerophosphodiester phosphodiesterase family protein [Arthrobacter sp.]|uniref:glycerophosphodiester phosphodiesterase family protein n=1 Tax=Arthrobacter sp. TaxID=1667 RepID=UPI003A90F227